MLKQELTYKNFDEEEVTKTFYFNISKAEVIEMELGLQEGYAEFLQRIVKAQSKPEVMEAFKAFVLKAYGEKSSDGEKFVKSDDLRDSFACTAAYSELFTKLVTETDFAVKFMNGVLPKDLTEAAAKVQDKSAMAVDMNKMKQPSLETVATPPVLEHPVEPPPSAAGVFGTSVD